jgi:hypothetical protein
MMAERGITLTHTTILRWVQRYVPEMVRRLRSSISKLQHHRFLEPGEEPLHASHCMKAGQHGRNNVIVQLAVFSTAFFCR